MNMIHKTDPVWFTEKAKVALAPDKQNRHVSRFVDTDTWPDILGRKTVNWT